MERVSSQPPPPGPAEKLLGEWPELGAFGVDWVKKCLVRRERLIEIAKVLRRWGWRGRGRWASSTRTQWKCMWRGMSKAYCAQNGSAREVKLTFSFYFEEQRRVGIDYAYYILRIYEDLSFKLPEIHCLVSSSHLSMASASSA
jgi:hypothetical protein